MSIAVYVRDRDGSERVIPIAGASELASRWRPLIAARGLHYLDYMLSAGLSIDSDNHADVLAEVETLCRDLAAAEPPELPTQSPAVRLLELLRATPPGTDASIYIG